MGWWDTSILLKWCWPAASQQKKEHAPEQTIEQTMETLVIWDAIALIMTSL